MSLRKSGNLIGAKPWNIEDLRTGFVKFYEIHGHYPNAYEVDAFEYLPSSRSIQRSFGGLVTLRKQLFPHEISSYTSGEYRKQMASKMYKRAQDYEERFWDRLCTIFQKIAVHEQKRIRPGGVSSDFFIFVDPENGVCIDTFYTKDLKSVANIVNIKLRRYSKLECLVILVAVNDFNLNQDMIDNQVKNRINRMPKHISVVTEDYFWSVTISDIANRSEYVIAS